LTSCSSRNICILVYSFDLGRASGLWPRSWVGREGDPPPPRFRKAPSKDPDMYTNCQLQARTLLTTYGIHRMRTLPTPLKCCLRELEFAQEELV